MSWLTDLAGKAENLLNKIDQNAAVVLKDTNLINEQLQDVIWKTTPSVRSQEERPSHESNGQIFTPLPLPRSSPSGAASPARRPSPLHSEHLYPKRSDDDLFCFLNSSEPILPATEELRGSPSGASIPSAGSSSPVNSVDISSRSHSRSHSQGGMSSMSSSFVSTGRDEYQQGFKPVERIESYNQEEEVNQSSVNDVLAENNLLKNEVRCLNNELALLLQRTKGAEKEVSVTGQELRMLKETLAKTEQAANQLKCLQNQLTETEKSVQNLIAENKRLKDNNTAIDNGVAKDLAVSIESLKQLKSEHECLTQESNELRLQVSRLQASVADTVQQNERCRSQIKDITNEAEQYRARATRVLQEKEKLIAGLQADKQIEGQGVNNSMTDQEIEQLRDELQLLRQESATLAKQLVTVRNDLHLCELQQEEHRQRAETEIERLQKKLQEERSRRQSAEEDYRCHLEEWQTSKYEMNHQYDYLKGCLQAKDTEISQLKQKAHMSSNTSQSSNETAELEARVRNLATTLIQKQGALEALIAERNSLRLKLERVELNNQPLSGAALQSTTVNAGTVLNVGENETVARLRVPTLLSESPGDTVVARRVKRAYSSLDTLGIRVGAFLRRYPLARIFVILYMVFLHLWVAIVLFSYSPEVYSSIEVAKNSPVFSPEEPQGLP